MDRSSVIKLSPKKRCAMLKNFVKPDSCCYGCYIIEGRPIPQARPRFGNGRCWDEQKQQREDYSFQFLFQHKPAKQFTGPLKISITFFMNKSKANKLEHHTIKPDLSNLIKFVEDSANGIIYNDDKQIIEITATKLYDDKPRTEIIIEELP